MSSLAHAPSEVLAAHPTPFRPRIAEVEQCDDMQLPRDARPKRGGMHGQNGEEHPPCLSAHRAGSPVEVVETFTLHGSTV